MMIGHKDEGVKMEAAFRALVLEYVEHQQSIWFPPERDVFGLQ